MYEVGKELFKKKSVRGNVHEFFKLPSRFFCHSVLGDVLFRSMLQQLQLCVTCLIKEFLNKGRVSELRAWYHELSWNFKEIVLKRFKNKNFIDRNLC